MFGSSIRQNGESQTPQGGFDHEKMVISSIKDGLRPAASEKRWGQVKHHSGIWLPGNIVAQPFVEPI